MADNFKAGQGAIWVQPDGPNTQPQYLGCHSVADVTIPKGSKTLTYCPDPARTGEFVVSGSYKGEKGAVTYTIEGVMQSTVDYLETIRSSGVPVIINKSYGGRRDTFLNFDRSFIFPGSSPSQVGMSGLLVGNPSDNKNTTTSYEMEADESIFAFKLAAARVSTTEVDSLNGIAIAGDDLSEGPWGPAQKVNDYIFVAGDIASGSAGNIANVLRSLKQGAFSATPANPFGAGYDVVGVQAFKLSAVGARVIVGLGTTVAGAPAKIAYSDDNGATWVVVTAGTVNAKFVVSNNALFALDRYHIWLGLDSGYILFSNDGGSTWVIQDAGVIASTAVAGIHFIDTMTGYCAYNSGVVAKTTDGGITWSPTSTTGSTDLHDIKVIGKYFVFVVGDDGMFYTHDGGVTWGERGDFTNITAVDFYMEMVGLAVQSGTNGNIYYTINGGYDWDILDAISNAGLNDVAIVNPTLAYVVGEASGGTGFIAKIQPK